MLALPSLTDRSNFSFVGAFGAARLALGATEAGIVAGFDRHIRMAIGDEIDAGHGATHAPASAGIEVVVGNAFGQGFRAATGIYSF
jgi:hypothetical protein